MRKSMIILALGLCLGLAGCYENMEDRAERECKEYTKKNCPTPEQNNTILDSLVFDRPSRTMIHYYTLTWPADDSTKFTGRQAELHAELVNALKNMPEMKIYMDADFNFAFVYRSQRDHRMVLMEDTVKAAEYK